MADIITLNNYIRNKRIDNFYIFVGEEVGLINFYIRKMASMINAIVYRTDDYRIIKNNLKIKSLIPSKFLYVIYEPELTDDEINELINPKEFIKTNSVLVLKYLKLKENSKIKKRLNEYIINFNRIDDEILIEDIKKIYKSNDTKIYKSILSYCNYDWEKLQSELQKIKILKNLYNWTEDELAYNYLQFLEAKPEDNIFKFIEKLFIGDKINSFKLLNEIIENGEIPFIIIQNMYLTVRNLISVLSSFSNNIENESGLKQSQIFFIKKYINFWNIEKALDYLRKINEIEKRIKRGKIEPIIACYLLWAYLYEAEKN